MKIGNRNFNIGHTYIMGILNVTPDSFSDGGSFNSLDTALKHTEEMIKDGADVIDIGGESTRPGYTRISETEEIERVAPVVEKIAQSFDIPISVDTYKTEVAEEVLKKGAHLINDIWGLKGEEFIELENGTSRMAEIIAKAGASVCIMENVSKKVLETSVETDICKRVLDNLLLSTEIALKSGIDEDKILLDPGVGFAKTYEDNLNTIKYLPQMCKKLKLPVLLGTSRKSVIGLTLDLDKSNRLEGTLATTAKAVEAGCMFVRVHDVKENYRFIKMIEAIM